MKAVRTTILVFTLTFLISPGQAWAALYNDVQASLICPACLDERMTVAACNDSTAEQIRQDIQQKLAAGQTKEQIIAGYVAQYGDIILAVPAKKGFNLMAWVMPVVATIGGTVLVYYAVTKWARNHSGRRLTVNSTSLIIDSEDEERLKEEIRKYL
ncbi:MAG: cytochrome c-type biogenesis protein CcmH [Clostridia bacterium]|nr:cytochrome c-type biogenesis protein CcmH [Clostridia bacterium]